MLDALALLAASSALLGACTVMPATATPAAAKEPAAVADDRIAWRSHPGGAIAAGVMLAGVLASLLAAGLPDAISVYRPLLAGFATLAAAAVLQRTAPSPRLHLWLGLPAGGWAWQMLGQAFDLQALLLSLVAGAVCGACFVGGQAWWQGQRAAASLPRLALGLGALLLALGALATLA